MLFAIITTNPNYSGEWVNSLEKYQTIEYDIIDISMHDWMDKCLRKKYDVFLLRPPGIINTEKQMFDEKVSILSKLPNVKVYPSLEEVLIYENKKYLSYWLQSQNIDSPQTNVFYKKRDAIDFITKVQFPVVAKINIGASGKGVKILNTNYEALCYIKKAFTNGIRPYIGPNFRIASILTKLKNLNRKKGLLKSRVNSYISVYREPQKFVILQEYVPHEYEWRVVVIGESFFAHKKVVNKGKASGSLIKEYGNPNLEVLSFVRDIVSRTKINSVSMDVFETNRGFLVNEIQVYFGQSDSFQMKVDGIEGRYRYVDNNWVFEPGDYASNQCYDLRLRHVLQMLEG
jgi:glutathione synthase/RimK-type ligase-like ATP-grasp enzyme